MTTQSTFSISILHSPSYSPAEQRPASPAAKLVHFANAQYTVGCLEIDQHEYDPVQEEVSVSYADDEEPDEEDNMAEVILPKAFKKSTGLNNFVTRTKCFFRRKKRCLTGVIPFNGISYKLVGLEDSASFDLAETSVSDELVKTGTSPLRRFAEFFKKRQLEKELQPTKPSIAKPPITKKSAFDEAAVPLMKDASLAAEDDCQEPGGRIGTRVATASAAHSAGRRRSGRRSPSQRVYASSASFRSYPRVSTKTDSITLFIGIGSLLP
ncbi:hypothetical protein POJ06DRAFT_236363 [Lipomyces tetrasporus]|uniref:Uncharacterized protein n=1 Tax=Lipomyces tetrasporus TaxID=54092 RepID=A0AAD7QUT8_9ASCO|nr:uncharacterized protein POJ06DRAFT_236363 [Lipomyces tetrasporus]KAJ8101688.1 hypothetical protein POJ06DRAFT_236363 [Lipomyces tetrasporus]